MVAPIVLGGVAYVGILAVVGTVGPAAYAYLGKREDGMIDSLSEAAYNKLQEEGLPILESIIDELGSGLASIGSNLGNATLEVIEFAGPRIVDGVDNTYDYIRDKIRGYEPAIIEAITFGFLTVLTVVYIWNSAKRGE